MSTIKIGSHGEYIVALHGIQATNKSWISISEQLKSNFKLILPNLIGRKINEVDVIDKKYSLDEYAKDLHSHLKKLDTAIWLAGWSTGVSVILQYVSIYGTAKIKGLILLSGSPSVGLTHWFKSNSVESISLEAQQRQLNLGLDEVAHPIAVAKTWLELKKSDQRPILPTINVPTLILHGTDDDQCPVDHAHFMADKITPSELIIFPNAGHNILKERPSEITSNIEKFIHRNSNNL